MAWPSGASEEPLGAAGSAEAARHCGKLRGPARQRLRGSAGEALPAPSFSRGGRLHRAHARFPSARRLFLPRPSACLCAAGALSVPRSCPPPLASVSRWRLLAPLLPSLSSGAAPRRPPGGARSPAPRAPGRWGNGGGGACGKSGLVPRVRLSGCVRDTNTHK